jgi:hypothetical protein
MRRRLNAERAATLKFLALTDFVVGSWVNLKKRLYSCAQRQRI